MVVQKQCVLCNTVFNVDSTDTSNLCHACYVALNDTTTTFDDKLNYLKSLTTGNK